MKKKKKAKKSKRKNPVAKFANDFNRAKVFADRSKYNRKKKYEETDDE